MTPAGAWAATFTVSNTADSGAGSLRQAIIDANAAAGDDIIVFDSALNGQTITPTAVMTAIASNIDIQGPGADLLTVTDPAAPVGTSLRAFTVNAGATVSISGLTITRAGTEGGGLHNEGNLTLTECALVNGLTLGGVNGGAIRNQGSGNLVLVACTFSGNDTTVSGGSGGAISCGGGTLTAINTTFSGNMGSTGGAVAIGGGASGSFDSCTVTNNIGVSAGGITGGGTLNNTIVAGNMNSGAGPTDLNGAYTGNFNLIGVNTGSSGLVDGVNGNQVGTSGSPLDPMLDALADNGGPTQTHNPQAGSPAIDAGMTTQPFDQRGAPRLFDAGGGAVSDIGSVEFGATCGMGGADTFGYTFEDSECPGGPAPNFIDISGLCSATETVLSDDSFSAAIPMGFTFNYYGADFTDMFIASDGWISPFMPAASNLARRTPELLPDASTPDGIIAGWWADMNSNNGTQGTFHSATLGAPGNRVFIVQCTALEHFLSGNPSTFQYQLFEASGNIEIHYQSVQSDGSNHSVGIENAAGDDGLSYHFDTTALSAPLAVRFLHPAGGGPDAPAVGSADPCLSIDDVTQNEGAGTMTFTITSTAPVASDVTVQVDTMDDTAQDENGDNDYLSIVAQTATITTGNSSTTVVVTINDDMVNEADETFFVNLSNIAGPAVLGDAQGLGTIVNDDFCLMGGPDSFGYTFLNSECPGGPALDFEDISGTGTALTLGDDDGSLEELCFAFNFYGTNFTQVLVGSNGALTFDGNTPDFTNVAIPNANIPNAIIAPFWDDLDPNNGNNGTIHVQMLGTAPSRRFIVQYTDVPHFPDASGPNSGVFQVKLHECTNDIEFQYQAAFSDGGDQTIGIENLDGSDGLQYDFGDIDIASPLAVLFVYPDLGPNTPPMTPSIVTDPVNVEQGQSATVSNLATVSDAEDAPSQLTAFIKDAPAGVTVSNVSVSSGGVVSATFSADCSVATGPYTLELNVSDTRGCGATPATFTLVVDPDITPPTVQCVDLTVQLPDVAGSVTIDPLDISFEGAELTVNIQLDNFPNETTWIVEDSNLNVVASGGPYPLQNFELVSDTADLSCGESYTFTIIDGFGDGLEAGPQTGTYEVLLDGAVVVPEEPFEGGDGFGSNSESRGFSVAPCLGGTSDACGLLDLSLDIDTFFCSDAGLNMVTLTATDVNGNMASCTATVTVLGPPADVIPTDPEPLNKISGTQGDTISATGGLDPRPGAYAVFGASAATLSVGGMDLVAMGSHNTQTVWLLVLSDGELISQTSFSAFGLGGFPTGVVQKGSNFGASVAWLSDSLLAVGAPVDDTGGSNRGAVWLVPVNPLDLEFPVTGAPTRVADGDAGLTLANNVNFGTSLSALDTGGDGAADLLAVGAPGASAAAPSGTVWLMTVSGGSLTAAGNVAAQGALAPLSVRFGASVAWLGDLDDDAGTTLEIAVGAPWHQGTTYGAKRGAVAVLSLEAADMNNVMGSSLFGANGIGGFPAGLIDNYDLFGNSLASFGDLDGDGHFELAIGAPDDDDGQLSGGGVWIVSVNPCDFNASGVQEKVTAATTGFDAGGPFGPIDRRDAFGYAVAPLTAPGTFLSGATGDDDGGGSAGAVWVVDLGADAP